MWNSHETKPNSLVANYWTLKTLVLPLLHTHTLWFLLDTILNWSQCLCIIYKGHLKRTYNDCAIGYATIVLTLKNTYTLLLIYELAHVILSAKNDFCLYQSNGHPDPDSVLLQHSTTYHKWEFPASSRELLQSWYHVFFIFIFPKLSLVSGLSK